MADQARPIPQKKRHKPNPAQGGNTSGEDHPAAKSCGITYKDNFSVKINHVGETTLDLYRMKPGDINRCFGAIHHLTKRSLAAADRGLVDTCIAQVCVEILRKAGVGCERITDKTLTPQEFHPKRVLGDLVSATAQDPSMELNLQGTPWENKGFEDLALASILLYAIKPYYKAGSKINFDYFTTRISKIKSGGTITDEEEGYIIAVGTIIQSLGTSETQGALTQAMHRNINRAQLIQLVLCMEESSDSKVKGVGSMCKLVASYHNMTKVKLVLDMISGTFEPISYRPYGSQAIKFRSAVRRERAFYTIKSGGSKVQELFEFSRVIDQNNCPTLTEARYKELYELGVFYHKIFKKENFTNFQGSNTNNIPEHIKEMVKNGSAGIASLESDEVLKKLGINLEQFHDQRPGRPRSRSPQRHQSGRKRYRADRSRDAGYSTREQSPYSSEGETLYR